MWDTAIEIIIWTGATYLLWGHLLSWKWMIEARIKCVDVRDPVWSEFLKSVQGIVSFTILATIFWLPASISNFTSRNRKKNKVESKWVHSFQKAIELYQQLQAWRRNDIQ